APKEWRGGNSQHTRNLRCMHDEPQDVLIDAYPEEEYWQDLLKVTASKTNEHLARLVIRSTATCRDTAAMALLLIIHLATVMTFFLTIPFGKFAHGFYRSAALLKFAVEEHITKYWTKAK
ncbi:MAG: FAD-binding dehydrogenase, partial [Acinetobacter sp.]